MSSFSKILNPQNQQVIPVENFLRALNFFAKSILKRSLVIIDNAGFHACQNITIPKNIKLIRIPPYPPELNPAEKVWQ
ncbi:MAG: hypothetical protein GKR88_00845 [Flavobacteriaceae bacterium]|nr:MAG: hypothetical protein GKR88_00845 [Flavobacteriaceae bacterium]